MAPGTRTHLTGSSHTKSRRRLVLIVLALVTVTLGLLLLLRPATDDGWYDKGMSIGSYEGKSATEIQAELDRQVAEGEMEVSVAPTIRVDGTTGVATVRMENSPKNRRDQKFSVTLDDGTLIYQSGAVPPGSHLQTVELTTVPAIGTHEATVTFQGYDRITHEEVGGSVGASVSVVVE